MNLENILLKKKERKHPTKSKKSETEGYTPCNHIYVKCAEQVNPWRQVD